MKTSNGWQLRTLGLGFGLMALACANRDASLGMNHRSSPGWSGTSSWTSAEEEWGGGPSSGAGWAGNHPGGGPSIDDEGWAGDLAWEPSIDDEGWAGNGPGGGPSSSAGWAGSLGGGPSSGAGWAGNHPGGGPSIDEGWAGSGPGGSRPPVVRACESDPVPISNGTCLSPPFCGVWHAQSVTPGYDHYLLFEDNRVLECWNDGKSGGVFGFTVEGDRLSLVAANGADVGQIQLLSDKTLQWFYVEKGVASTTLYDRAPDSVPCWCDNQMQQMRDGTW